MVRLQSTAATSRLRSDNVTLTYGADPVVADLSLAVPDGKITTIIGPNGCGKSTVLRALARLLRPSGGAVVLDGQLIHRLPTREVARRLGLLHQQTTTPNGILVEDLVRRGRYPHQAFLQPPSRRDEEAVDRALQLTGMTELRRRHVDQLSGGQRQRAWMAMALAQETPLLLLDEPTTFLDVAHQLDVVDLIQRLNAEEGRTIVMVLHDVNEAARASHHIVAMRDGRILRAGPPSEVLEPALLAELYGIPCDVYPHPARDVSVCVPCGRPIAECAACRTVAPGFELETVRAGYDRSTILHDLSLTIPPGMVTAIVGPNGCGKSTLLRTCGRLLKPATGTVRLEGQPVHRGSHRALAKRLALLTQGPVPPSGFLVEDLVAAGRTPHQSFLRQWRAEDEAAVEGALRQCGLADLRYREIETLSGGQRQRAWMAMALAQETPVLLLDEPTTFLDVAAQIELLELVRQLNRTEGRSVVMVLHDLNLAARYADRLVAMKEGQVVAAGTPAEVITPALLRDVFAIDATIIPDPRTGMPLVLPESGVGDERQVMEPVAEELVGLSA
jgi:iron complex transport system ATP-binding protein